MKVLILTALLLVSGCGMSPEMRQNLGAALVVSSQNWQNTQDRIAAQNACNQNQWYQRNMLYEMQNQNRILQQRRWP
jgi:hypothetical protein